MRFHIVVPVWGEVYIDRWMRHVLPAHFGAGNLPAFAAHGHEAVLHIHTLSGDVERFGAYSALEAARDLLPVAIHGHELRVDDLPQFYLLTELYNRAITGAGEENAAMIMWQPDCVLSGGAMERIIELREGGCRAVMVPGLLVETEAFIRLLPALGQPLPRGRAFTELALGCLHDPEIEEHMWSDARLSEAPSFLYWRDAPGGALLVRAFHPHPIMIDPVDRDCRCHWTPDAEYVRRACPDFRDIYCVSDSDELVVTSFSPANATRFQRSAPVSSSIDGVARWIHIGADAYHRRFFANRYWVHDRPLDGACKALQAQSDRVVESVLRRADELESLVATLISGARGREIAIFGAGALGQLLARALVLNDCPPVIFLDNDPTKWGRIFGLVPIAKPEVERLAGRFVVVASLWSDEICESLDALGLRELEDYRKVAPDAVWHGLDESREKCEADGR